MKTLDFDRIKQIFKSNKIPYYFISPSNFNLINLHQWVHNWTNINYLNCFDDNERSCLVPHDEKKRAFASLEKINEFLLEHPSTIEKINSDIEEAGKGNAIFLFFNQKLQQICKELNLQLILPENDIVKSIDNKITTTEIGNEAQVFSVDNFLGKVKSYDSLVKICEEHNLGLDLVIQAPFGDSGKTTYFINSQEFIYRCICN